MRVLTLNAGSTSLKAHLVDGGVVVAAGTADWRGDNRAEVLRATLEELGVAGRESGPAGAGGFPDRAPGVDVVAHRIVHGGDAFTEHVVIDDEVEAGIAAVGSLAPLHNAAGLEVIRFARRILPDVPHVACFDTAFHATLPELARREPVPDAWRALGVRRYGFHGLSVEWSLGRAAELLGRPSADLALVVAHLGGGASITAVAGGRSIWSSMGYTPNDGIMMATRSGAIDPAIVTFLIRRQGWTAEAVDRALERESGLLGVSGRSADARVLRDAASAGDAAAALALDLFAARAAAGIAGAASWLPRVDGLVFTAGIGEHDPTMRRTITERLAVLGVPALGTEVGPSAADPATVSRHAEDPSAGDSVLAGGPPAVLRIAAREELVMAAIASRLSGSDGTATNRGATG